MISLFGNASTTLSADAVSASLASSAISKNPALLPATDTSRGHKWFSFGRTKKRLQMVESVSLGEKRFVALVKVDGRQFLIGGAPSNVGMLAELTPEESFHQVLKEATQGLDIPVPASVSTEPAPTPVSASAVQTPAPIPAPAAAPLPAAYRQNVLATAPPVAVSARPAEPLTVVQSVAALPAMPSEVISQSAPVPVTPVPPIHPVDLALEEPISLSPSLLAAMHARIRSAEAPAPQIAVQERASTITPQTFDTLLAAPQPVEMPSLAPESRQLVREVPRVPAPAFTFQVSHFLNLGIKAAAWNLQGATS